MGTRDVLRAYCTRIRYLICIFSHPASSGLISSSASAPSQLLFVIFSVASKQRVLPRRRMKSTATSFKGAITQEFNCTSISISGSYKYEDGACPVQTNVGVALPAWISRVGVIDSWHSPRYRFHGGRTTIAYTTRVCILMHNTTLESMHTMDTGVLCIVLLGVGVWIGNRRQQQIYLLGRESSPALDRSARARPPPLLPSSRVA